MPDATAVPTPIAAADIPYRWIREELQFPGSLRRGARSKRVRFVQECLALDPTIGTTLRIDGDFGPGTEAAIMRFQSAKGLTACGVVDADTHTALTLPFLRALAPIDPRGRSLGELAVAYAYQHLAEHPLEVGGQNKGPWVRLYMQGMESLWCAAFVCFLINQAADTLGVDPPVETTFSCDVLAARGRAAGIFLSEQDLADEPARRASITPGSIFLSRRVPGDWTHTGLITNASLHEAGDAEFFDTIEGNTNDDGHRDGYEVCARIRGFTSRDFITIA